MESLLSTFPIHQRCSQSAFSFTTATCLVPNHLRNSNSRLVGLSNMLFLTKNSRLLEAKLNIGRAAGTRDSGDGEGVGDDAKQKQPSRDWEAEFLGEVDPLGVLPSEKRKKPQKSKLLQETDSMDWCVRARKIALKSIGARGLTSTMEDMVTATKKKKKNKKKNKKKQVANKKKTDELDEADEDDLDFDADVDFGFNELNSMNDSSQLRRKLSVIAGGMFEKRKEKTMEAFVERLSQFSGPSDRRQEINLNKSIVEAQTAEEVLEVTAEIIMAVGKGLSPSPLSPLNIATALHRIAKNMEKVSMLRTHRLAFTRQREMSMLVGMAMMALPDCSAQGISNIAWALSKIGGELLYLSEMERVAEVALTKVGEFNSQNVANIAGAFASMHHSAPQLFSELSKRASHIIHTFYAQEIAQVLWAFASLYEPADLLLESLDNQIEFESLKFNVNRNHQLGNIAWSYAVLGQMDRPFFAHVWKTLSHFEDLQVCREDIMFASQVHLVNQFLKLEGPPHLQLSDVEEEKIASAGRTKKFNQKVTSSFQKDVARLLVSTGLDWVREYAVDGYTLDAALVDQKVALEIDGPTHFSRNTGVPLGHTMVKRRYITAAGWKLVALSHQEWEEVEGEFKQLEYLRKILEDHIGWKVTTTCNVCFHSKVIVGLWSESG